MQVPAAKPQALPPATITPATDAAAQHTALDAFAPKKPHLDLQRDASKALRKLERATQRAIDELRVEVELQEGHALAEAAPT